MNRPTIMAVGGHIGDAELTAGGTLATYALKGYHIVTVALTGGERGNPPELSVAEYRKQKEAEAHAFAEKLNGTAYVFPPVDGELIETEELKFALCDLIRKHRPTLLMTHWKNSMHKDHIVTSKIVRDAQFYAGLPSIERVEPAHFVRGPYYAENWEDSDGFVPYVYIPVSEEGYNLWREAILIHRFTVESKSFAYRDYYSHLMALRGALIRRPYAEAFAVEDHTKKIVLDDFN